jgi:hypothetical protein
MVRRVVLALAACAAVGAVGAAPGLSDSQGRQLEGTLGPGLTIHLTQDGTPVTSLRPGNYRLTVTDNTRFHNFHVFGPGLDDEVTGVPAEMPGRVTVKIHLSHGTYTFQCDPHADMGMRGTFDVGGVGQVG